MTDLPTRIENARPEDVRGLRDCEQCGGTGQSIYMRSWFIQDGLRKERCGICAGTGKSDYVDHDRNWIKKQAAWRASFPHHPAAAAVRQRLEQEKG